MNKYYNIIKANKISTILHVQLANLQLLQKNRSYISILLSVFQHNLNTSHFRF